MSTTKNRKKSVTAILAAAVATAAAPAILFATAGTAQAATSVNTASDALGVTVTIDSSGSSGSCKYSAVPLFTPPGNLKPLPVYDVPFYLQAGQSHNLWFPGIQTGTVWQSTVECDDGTFDLDFPVY